MTLLTGPRGADTAAVTAWRLAGGATFCGGACYDDGVYLGCHRGEDHPEGPRPSWHLDLTRASWWTAADNGVVIRQAATIGGGG